MPQCQIALVIVPKMNIGAVLNKLSGASLMPNMLSNTSEICPNFV